MDFAAWPGLRDFWSVYRRHYSELQEGLVPLLGAHPTFGPLIARSTVEQRAAQDETSRLRLERAIESGDWAENDAELARQGAMYAEAGIRFSEWYDVIRLVAKFLTPKIVAAYADDHARLVAALDGGREFFDRSMGLLAESYLARKERIIREKAMEIERGERTLMEALASLDEGVVVISPAGDVIYRNRAAAALAEASGTWCAADGAPLSDLDRPAARAARGEHFSDVEVTLHGAPSPGSRDVRTVTVTSAPIRGTSDQVLGAVLTTRDVTAQKRLEAERRVQEEILLESRRVHEANRLKSEFLANMSHELRTPLNSIIGFAALLREGRVGALKPKQEEFIGDILTSGKHLLQLINDVLDLSKVEAGKMQFFPEPIDVRRVVSEVATLLREVAAAKAARVDVDVHEAVRSAVLDPARLKQVLYNYVSNALKFIAEGGRVAIRVEPAGPDRLRIAVEDDGVGIAPGDLSRLFSEFEQLDAGADKKHGGTGLGLALTKRLVEAQGGVVGVTSVLGGGSTFTAELPRQMAVQARPGRTPRPLSETTASHRRILVVEDDPHDQARVTKILTDAGYSVDVAGTGREAIERCKRANYEAITLDILLPDMSGIEALRAIREDARNSTLPVIIITVVAEQVASGYPVTDALAKPVRPEALVAALSRTGVKPPVDIVVVDDDPASLKLMRETVAQLGGTTSCFSDASDALAAIASSPPRLVIVDLLMPGVDGFAFLQRLRARPALARLPVLVWTVKDLSAHELSELRRSAECVVGKTSHADLVRILEMHLGGADAAA